MDRLAARLGARTWARTLPAQIGVAVAAGLLVAALAFFVLEAIIAQRAVDPGAAPSSAGAAANPRSLAARLSPGKVAVSAPPQGAEALLVQAQPGDRLDVIAVFPATATQPVVSATIIRGAVLVERPIDTSGSPAVIEVSPEEAMVLTHVVQSGTHVVYALWPARGNPPGLAPPDGPAIRERFGPN